MFHKVSLWGFLYIVSCYGQVFGNSDYRVGHPTGVSISPMNLVSGPTKLPASGTSEKSDKVTDILHTLLSKYDNRIRPFFPDAPVLIIASIPRVQIVDVIESKQELSSTLVLQQSWKDARLDYSNYEYSDDIPYITINHEHTREIWLPDTHFLNEKKAQILEKYYKSGH
ncbi:unnamed protein product [Orchesella dallaii]|uniref:Neurotransmitter-gated ion-channel ligand-binding domain-containing protein n=1 Tax=Orchesella dallaii TaxID=48710 RepID=A0ABP1RD54_9HEXA